MQVATKDLVQAIEIWRPDEAGKRLRVCSAVYGTHEHVEQQRRELSYASGDAVVGQAWASGMPIVQSIDDALVEGIEGVPVTHVVAYPVMKSGECRGVVVLWCDGSDDLQAAFEVWRPNDRNELALRDGWHPQLERFGLISQFVKFPRRAGLPGKVWADRFPRVMGALGSSQQFMRVAGAKADGLSTGLGLPVMRTGLDLDAVFVMLSANSSPIARVMEVWAMDPSTKSLKIISADYGPYIDLAPLSRRITFRPEEGIAGRVFRDGAPWATWDLLGVEFPRGEKFAEYGFRWGVGIPVYVGDELRAVATLIH